MWRTVVVAPPLRIALIPAAPRVARPLPALRTTHPRSHACPALSSRAFAVGYGDLSPTTGESRGVTIVMIFVGVVFVFSQVGSALGMVISPITSWGRNLLDRLFPRKLVDIDGDGEADFSYPRHWFLFYAKGFLPSLVLNLVVQALSAGAFNAIEGWEYGIAFYHCLVTATTVGYGDVYIATEGGRIWSCFHILISVVMVGEGISTIGVLQTERSEEMDRLEQLNRKLDANMLDSLLECAAELRATNEDTGADADASQVSELEFVLAMLLQLGVCKWSNVRPIIKKFRALDTDGSGMLGKSDLKMLMSNKSADELQKEKSKGDTPREPQPTRYAPTAAYPPQYYGAPSVPPTPVSPSRMGPAHFPPQPPQQQPPPFSHHSSSYEMMPPPGHYGPPPPGRAPPPPQYDPRYGHNYAAEGYPGPGGSQMPPPAQYYGPR